MSMLSLFASAALAFPLVRTDMNVRDPFVMTDGLNQIYRLYSAKPWSGGDGVYVQQSPDLEKWTAKRQVLKIPPSIKSTIKGYWAPEVHAYNGRYYLFVTLDRTVGWRGVWIFVSDNPDGPFELTCERAVTPTEWSCLDGTLYVEDGVPYMVFCHEWTQIGNGRMMCARLNENLSSIEGDPEALFSATDYTASPVCDLTRKAIDHVTDGPFLYRASETGRLFMIWSNMTPNGYAEIICESESGRISGPWRSFKVLAGRDGGHGMIFRNLSGKLVLTMHGPNDSPRERMRFLDLVEGDAGLEINACDDNPVPALGQNASDQMDFDLTKPGRRVLFVGNSITLHGPRHDNGVNWDGGRGMAASSPEKDYVHLLQKRIREVDPQAQCCLMQVASSFEQGFYKPNWSCEAYYKMGRAFKPDIVIFFFGANVPQSYNNGVLVAARTFGQALEDLRDYLDNGGKTKFFHSEGFYNHPNLDAEKSELAARRGDVMVSLADIRANPEAKGLYNHPGDVGMALIAERFWQAISSCVKPQIVDGDRQRK